MKKIIAVALAILLALAPVLAVSPVIDLSLKVWKTDNVRLVKSSVIQGIDSESSGDGEYRLVLEDVLGRNLWQKNYDLRFVADASVPRPVPYVIIEEKIPYSQSAYRVSFYNGKRRIFYTVLDFCDSNERCDGRENYISCPSDCERERSDGICYNDMDDFCDSDCLEGYDPDCRSKELFVKWSFVALMTVILLSLIAAILEFRKISKIYSSLLRRLKRLFESFRKL